MLCRCFLFIPQCGWRVDIHYVSPRWILDSVLLQLPHEYVYTRACKGLYQLGCVWRFNTMVCVCLFSFFFTHVRLFSVFVQGCCCLPVTFLLSLPDILCFFIVLRSTFASLSVPCFFPLCDISLPCGGCHAFGCQFSQTVAYATVCICNLITDAPH